MGTFGATHLAEFAGRSSRAAKVFAASASMPGRTCWYFAMVNPGVECRNRSLTTLMGAPALEVQIGVGVTKVMEPDAWQCRLAHEALEGV
jgi:hypothetical protein